MGGTCSTYGSENRYIPYFGGRNLNEGDHLEYPGVDVRIILKWIFEKWDWGHGLDRSGSG
jgi:hypothetical protein